MLARLGFKLACVLAARSQGEGYHSKYRSNQEAFRKLVALTAAMRRAMRTYQEEQVEKAGELVNWQAFKAGDKKNLLVKEAWEAERIKLQQLLLPYLEKGADIGFMYAAKQFPEVDISVHDKEVQKPLLARAKASAKRMTDASMDRIKNKLLAEIDLRPALAARIDPLTDMRIPLDIDKGILMAIQNVLSNMGRAEGVADTETIFSLWTGQGVWAKEGGATKKIWQTQEDDRVCPICEPLDGEKISIDEVFESENGGEDSPPIHDRCRCYMDVE